LFIISNSFNEIPLFYIIKGECIIETGYFFFNTEAHPIDGASLECCRVLKSTNPEVKNESLSLLKRLNLTKLINRHIELNSKHSNVDIKGLNEEYKLLKKQEELEQLNKDSLRLNICSKMINNTAHREFIINSWDLYSSKDSPFTCSLENQFSRRMSFINNQNYFP